MVSHILGDSQRFFAEGVAMHHALTDASQKTASNNERFHFFHRNYDDMYWPHFAARGDKNKPLEAIVHNAIVALKETHGHMPLCYKNCAISSGTNPHLDAVTVGHHTSDKLNRIIGTDKHLWQNIIRNSERSLERAHQVEKLWREMLIIKPTAFEGSTRILSKDEGRHLTGGLSLDAADYMFFWNMVIDSCKGFILDDVALDAPSIDRVMKEIELAQSWSEESRGRYPIHTSDWANSRNSILEMARGNYVRFGLNPHRPDAEMDMRFYDEASNALYPATLVACVKPVIQSMLRWASQGIVTEEACRTVARLFNIHRMRIDPDYNAKQDLPLDLSHLSPLIRDPSQAEMHEFKQLIDKVEPFMLNYCAHMIRPDGLPDDYAKAHKAAPVQIQYRGNDILNGEDLVRWQRENISSQDIGDLWALTVPQPYDPKNAFTVSPSISNDSRVQPKRQHNFQHGPFTNGNVTEIWQDRPFDDLSPMMKEYAQFMAAAIEVGSPPQNAPDFHGVRFDLKRGFLALEQAKEFKTHDISLLPGSMGKAFKSKVGEPNWERLRDITKRLQAANTPDASIVFGTQQVRHINDTFKALSDYFTGPGPDSPPSDFRLALEMEMLRRNYTDITFQEGWECSEDSARMIIQATKIELGLIERPAKNNTQMAVLNEDGSYISFFERYEKLRSYLDGLQNDDSIKQYIAQKDSSALESLGVRHVSLALARLIEMYDSFNDSEFNQTVFDGAFELQKLEHPTHFKKDIHEIDNTKFETLDNLLENWVWLWSDDDLREMRVDYRDSWLETHGIIAMETGPKSIEDQAIKHKHRGYRRT